MKLIIEDYHDGFKIEGKAFGFFIFSPEFEQIFIGGGPAYYFFLGSKLNLPTSRARINTYKKFMYNFK